MERAATDRAAVAGENPAGARVWVGGADGCADVCTIIVWARETGRAAPLRRDRREGLKAVGQAGKARARTAGYGKSAVGSPRPSAGEQAARAQAQAPTRATSLAAVCMRVCHTMRDACKCAVGGDRSWGQGQHAPHGHGQGMDTATKSDAFGITSCILQSMPAHPMPPAHASDPAGCTRGPRSAPRAMAHGCLPANTHWLLVRTGPAPRSDRVPTSSPSSTAVAATASPSPPSSIALHRGPPCTCRHRQWR
jgi:hypothetical protein